MYLPRIVEHLHAQAQQRQLELEGVQLSRGGVPGQCERRAPRPRNRPHCRVAKKKRCVLMHDHSPAPPPEVGPHRGQLQRKPAAACQMVAHAPVVGGDAFWWSECNAVGRSSYVVGAFHRRALPSPGFACCSCPRWGPPSGGGAGRVRVIVYENAPFLATRFERSVSSDSERARTTAAVCPGAAPPCLFGLLARAS